MLEYPLLESLRSKKASHISRGFFCINDYALYMDMYAKSMVPDRQQRGQLEALERAPAHKGLHTVDILRRDAGQLNILSPL